MAVRAATKPKRSPVASGAAADIAGGGTPPEELSIRSPAVDKKKELADLKGVDSAPFDARHYRELTAQEKAERWPNPKYYRFLSLRLHDLKDRPVFEVPGVEAEFGQKLCSRGKVTVCSCSSCLFAHLT